MKLILEKIAGTAEVDGEEYMVVEGRSMHGTAITALVLAVSSPHARTAALLMKAGFRAWHKEEEQEERYTIVNVEGLPEESATVEVSGPPMKDLKVVYDDGQETPEEWMRRKLGERGIHSGTAREKPVDDQGERQEQES